MLRNLALIAALVLTPLAAQGQTSPETTTAEQLRLATQVFDAQGDLTESVRRSLMSGVTAGVFKSMPAEQQARVKSMLGDELASLAPELTALRPQMIALWAGTFSPEDLRAMADWYGSPTSKAIAVKTAASAAVLAHAELSPEERAAQDAFNASPAGQAVSRHGPEIAVASLMMMQPLITRIAADLQAKRCAIDDSCAKAP